MPSRFLWVLYQMMVILLFRGAPARILWSPCPDVFAYERTNPDNYQAWIHPRENPQWRALVKVKPFLPIFLKVKLMVPTLLPSKYVGRIELAEGKDKVVEKVNSGNSDKIKYYVYFPAKIPIPELILIEINSKIVCSQSSAPRRLKTILTLEHSLIAITTNVTTRGGVSMNRYPSTKDGKKFSVCGVFLKLIVLRTLKAYFVASIEEVVSKRIDCGKGLFHDFSNSEKPSVSIGDWPWMVPLFKKTDLGLQFFCSSTLISTVLVITAAHCIKFKNSEAVKKEDIIAYVGRFDISDWTEEFSQPRGVSQIFVHHDFDSEIFHSDLAILKFSKPVIISEHVAPACMWQGDEDLAAVVGKKGIVFGWGTDGLGRKITPTPKLAVMPIVSQEECLRSKIEFLFLTTNRTLCAGFRNGTGPCSGDSGGGLLLPRRHDDGSIRWVLRGVVSLSLMQENEMMCDVYEYTVFTDVAKFQNWLKQIEEEFI